MWLSERYIGWSAWILLLIPLVQMGRVCGIQLLIVTQSPLRGVISGLIKANFPINIAFTVESDVDSLVILGEIGAEKHPPYYLPEVKDEEVETDSGMVNMKKLDSRFEEAAKLVVTQQNASTSYL